MTDEEMAVLHKEYMDKHKKAFRIAFDTLKELWPPKNDAEWFANVAYPACADGYHQMDGDTLCKGLMLAVYGYLDEMAVKLSKGKAEETA